MNIFFHFAFQAMTSKEARYVASMLAEDDSGGYISSRD